MWIHWITVSYILLLVLKPFLVLQIFYIEYLLSLCRLLRVFNFKYLSIASGYMGLLIFRQCLSMVTLEKTINTNISNLILNYDLV